MEMNNRCFIIEWPSLGINVVAAGLNHNVEAQKWFIECLPLETIQGHAMVSGDLLYVMNLVMKKEPPIKYHDLVMEDLSEEKVGRVNFFATAGRIGSIMVKYGVITEPMRYPSIAQVREEDIPQLVKVGRAVWESIFRTKEPIKVVFRRGGEM